MQKMPPLTAAFSVCRNYSPASSDEFSHCWFAIPQLVLQADWQEVWHSPHPPFFALSQRLRVLRVFIIFILSSLRPYRRTVLFVLIYSITKCAICQYFFALDRGYAPTAPENARFRCGGRIFRLSVHEKRRISRTAAQAALDRRRGYFGDIGAFFVSSSCMTTISIRIRSRYTGRSATLM